MNAPDALPRIAAALLSWGALTAVQTASWPFAISGSSFMSVRRSLSLAVLVALAAGASHAESAAPGSGPNPFTDCGIGAALFPDVHWAAISSNVIWDVGTTAVTSATASPQTCSGKKVAAALFIRDTYERLAEETAQGQGEHLSTALSLLACDGPGQVAAVAATREALGTLVAQPAYATLTRLDKAAQYYGVMHTAVAQACAV
jgi:Protein of unknown function (DUF3015)